RGGTTEIVALLLDAGGDVESIWPWNESQPLHHAVQHNAVRTVKLLLDRGAPVDTVFDWEMPTTSLLWACHEGHLEMLNTLLDHGADTESKGFNGTALGFALHKRHTNIIQVLLKHGAKAEA
ncbi:ankyrin repeat protein, partial [Mycena crocata]